MTEDIITVSPAKMNVVLTKEFVVGEEDFPPISGSPCSQTSSPKASKDGESGYQSETSPMMGIEREDNGCKSPCAGSTCSSPRDYSSVVAGCIPKISSEVAVEVKKEKSESEEQLSKDKIPSLPKLDSLSDSILDYYEKVAQTENTLLKKLRLRDFLYYAIAHCFPVCGLYIVGSSLNGFGNETSDMDLCLVITNRELDQRTDAIQVLRAVEQLLSLMECVKSYQLIEAKVPILRIQFKDQYEGLTVDLNANNSVAIKNTHLLCYYAFSDWRVRPLVSIVKEWAKCCNINDASQSSFTSYSLVLMVIHYLQCGLDHPILPSLQSVYPKRFHPKLDIRTLNLSMKLEPPLLPGNPCVSLGELLTGFFKYYSSTFNYETDAISVRLGKRMDRGELVNQRIQWSPICIEEPFTKFNTAHSIFDVNVFNAIKDKFQEAHDILIEASDLTELLNVQPYESPYNAYTV